MTTISKQEFLGILHKHGWRQQRQEGNHQIWKHEDGRQERIAFPAMTSNHGDIGEGLAKELLVRFNLAPKEAGSTAQMLEVARKKKVRKAAAPGSVLAPEGTFGRRLFDARTAKGWSQGDLARRVGGGMTQGVLSQWERGASSPITADGRIEYQRQKPRLATIAEMFGWGDILEKTGPAPTKAAPTPTAPAATGAPRAITPSTPRDQEETDLDRELAKLRVRHPDEKAFTKSLMRLLRVSDVMQWLIEQENERRRMQAELDRYHREDAVGMRRKALAYDAMRADTEALLKRMKEAEAE